MNLVAKLLIFVLIISGAGALFAADTPSEFKVSDVLPMKVPALNKCAPLAGRMICAYKETLSLVTVQSSGEAVMQEISIPVRGKCVRSDRIVVCAPDTGEGNVFIIPSLQ